MNTAHAEIDLDLMARGWWRSPDGRHIRVIYGLDVVARDILSVGGTAVWGVPIRGAISCVYLWQRLIVVAPRLYAHQPWYCRLVWSHELGHLLVGRSEERVMCWQRGRYGDMVTPVWVA